MLGWSFNSILEDFWLVLIWQESIWILTLIFFGSFHQLCLLIPFTRSSVIPSDKGDSFMAVRRMIVLLLFLSVANSLCCDLRQQQQSLILKDLLNFPLFFHSTVKQKWLPLNSYRSCHSEGKYMKHIFKSTRNVHMHLRSILLW